MAGNKIEKNIPAHL